jgi:prepilin-type N-terminal cleavage/methylation domain-containing protein
MRRIDAKIRSAFSLIEMVCALAIAVLLLLALYVTLNTQIMHAQAGRETLAEGEVARGILTRISNDIANQLGAVDPRGFPVYDTSTPNPDGSMPLTTTDSGAAVSYNFGIRGDATSLTISSYRVQKAASATTGTTTATSSEINSDLRTVSLWLVMNGSDAAGLARNETKQATSQDIDTLPTDLPNQSDLVFAKEVKNIMFEYFDGTSWQTEWDGSAAAGEDGSSRVGPPAAIRVTLTLRRNNDPNAAAVAQDGDLGPTFQQIIALPASNWFPAPTTTP